MTAPGGSPTDRRLPTLVALVLRGGVALAGTITLLGGMGLLSQHGRDPADYHLFQGGAAPYRTFGEIVPGALRGESRALVQLGIVLLIATPVARVMLSLVGFALQRDRLYVVVTGLVGAALMVSLLRGGPL